MWLLQVVAVAGVDDAASVAGFGIMASIMFSTGGKIILLYIDDEKKIVRFIRK